MKFTINTKIFAAYSVVFLTSVFMVVYSTFDVGGTTETPEFFCGTANFSHEETREGRKLFKALCASCHKINKHLVGPALGNIEMDSIPFYQMLVEQKPQKHQPYFPQLTHENTNDIFNYLRNN